MPAPSIAVMSRFVFQESSKFEPAKVVPFIAAAYMLSAYAYSAKLAAAAVGMLLHTGATPCVQLYHCADIVSISVVV